MPRCIALFSGGLDSVLAVRLMQIQGIEVQGICFRSSFTCCHASAERAAAMLQLPLETLDQDDRYLQLLRTPRFGYGRAANPCLDCRIHMVRLAAQAMRDRNADFLVTGEVVGQRVASQKRADLDTVAFHAEVRELLLRPLSARLLPPTLPERQGWVHRDQLFDFQGQSRKPQLQLAKQLSLEWIPPETHGCLLTETPMAAKVFDLYEYTLARSAWQLDLLKTGRHFRIDPATKMIVGRNQADNEALLSALESEHAQHATLMRPSNFKGPSGLLLGPAHDASLQIAGSLLLRYVKHAPPDPRVSLHASADPTAAVPRQLALAPHPAAQRLQPIA
jgi:tRNA-uridine 2-sulfurtransferase